MALGGRNSPPGGVGSTNGIPAVRGFTDGEVFTQDTDFVSAAITEADDTVASTSTVLVGATAAITEASDSTAGTATVLVAATAAITEAADSVAATATEAISATAALTEDADSVTAAATVPIVVVVPDAQGGTVGGEGSRSTGGSPDRELHRYIQKLREAHEAGEVFARLNAVSIDTLSATALVGKSAMVAAKASNPRHDDEEAILVLLLAA